MFCFGNLWNDSNAEIGGKLRNNITTNIMQPLLAEKLPVFPVIRCTFSPLFVQHSYIMWSGVCALLFEKKKSWKITWNESKGRKNWNQEINNMNRCITNDKQHEITNNSDFCVHIFLGRKMWSNQYSVSILKGNDCVTIEYHNPLCFQSIYFYSILDEGS